MTQEGCYFIAKYLTKQIIHLEIDLFLIYVFLGKLEFEIIEGIDNGKFKDFVENVMRKQIGGPCISILNKADDVLMLNPTYKSLSGWKSHKRIDLMIKKQEIFLLQNHLKEVFKKECIEVNKKYDFINIDMESDSRAQYNKVVNKKKKETKQDRYKKKRKNRDWKHRKNNKLTNDKKTSNANKTNDK